MQALFFALFAAGIVAADQVTKYLTVTNIAISPRCIPEILKNIGKNMKKPKKTLAKWAYFLYNNSARKFSVVF